QWSPAFGVHTLERRSGAHEAANELARLRPILVRRTLEIPLFLGCPREEVESGPAVLVSLVGGRACGEKAGRVRSLLGLGGRVERSAAAPITRTCRRAMGEQQVHEPIIGIGRRGEVKGGEPVSVGRVDLRTG